MIKIVHMSHKHIEKNNAVTISPENKTNIKFNSPKYSACNDNNTCNHKYILDLTKKSLLLKSNLLLVQKLILIIGTMVAITGLRWLK